MVRGAENLTHLNQTAETILLAEDDPRRIEQGRGYYNRLLSVGTPDYIRRYVWSEFGRDPSWRCGVRRKFQVRLPCRADTFGAGVLAACSSSGRTSGGRRGPSSASWTTPVGSWCWRRSLGAGRRERTSGSSSMSSRTSFQFSPSSDTLVVQLQLSVTLPEPRETLSLSLTAFDLLKQCGLTAEPAPTNDLDPRLRGVEGFLGQAGRRAGPPSSLIGARCPTLDRRDERAVQVRGNRPTSRAACSRRTCRRSCTRGATWRMRSSTCAW